MVIGTIRHLNHVPVDLARAPAAAVAFVAQQLGCRAFLEGSATSRRATRGLSAQDVPNAVWSSFRVLARSPRPFSKASLPRSARAHEFLLELPDKSLQNRDCWPPHNAVAR